MGNSENIHWKSSEILEKQKATPIGTLSVQLKISRLVWLDGTPRGIRTPGLLVRRLSHAQIGVVSAPICAFYHRSLGGFSIVSVQPCPLFSDSGSKLGQKLFASFFQCRNVICQCIPYRENIARTVSANIAVSGALDNAPRNRLIQTVSVQGCWLMYAQQLIQLLDALLFCRCRFFQRADFILHTAVINISVMALQMFYTDITKPWSQLSRNRATLMIATVYWKRKGESRTFPMVRRTRIMQKKPIKLKRSSFWLRVFPSYKCRNSRS